MALSERTRYNQNNGDDANRQGEEDVDTSEGEYAHVIHARWHRVVTMPGAVAVPAMTVKHQSHLGYSRPYVEVKWEHLYVMKRTVIDADR